MSVNSDTSVNSDYPLSEQAAGKLRAASGRDLAQIDLAAAASNDLTAADLQIEAETLRAQANIASRAGYPQLANNLLRAAELTAVPNDTLLEIYDLLRPGRATFEALVALADRLEETYNAPANARFVREAAAVYRERELLKRA